MSSEQVQDRSAGDLVKQISEQTSRLVRQELALAQAELQEKGKRAGIGGGLMGAAAVAALYGVGALVAGVILVIATALDGWIAALIVAAGLFAGAGILALAGKRQVQRASPPVPEQATETVKADVEHVKRRAARS